MVWFIVDSGCHLKDGSPSGFSNGRGFRRAFGVIDFGLEEDARGAFVAATVTPDPIGLDGTAWSHHHRDHFFDDARLCQCDQAGESGCILCRHQYLCNGFNHRPGAGLVSARRQNSSVPPEARLQPLNCLLPRNFVSSRSWETSITNWSRTQHLVYGYIMVPLTAWIVFRSRFGLRLRATGKIPWLLTRQGFLLMPLATRPWSSTAFSAACPVRIFPPHSLLFVKDMCG